MSNSDSEINNNSWSWYDYIKDITNPLDYVKENFQYFIVNNLDKIPMSKDIVASYYCMLDDKTPLTIKITIAGTLAYIILPVDLIPDLTPILGFSDDITAFMATLTMISSYITEEHYKQSQELFDSLKT